MSIVSSFQDPSGRVLEKYTIISREEELTVLQQFTRFAETRNISQELLLQDTKSLQQVRQLPSNNFYCSNHCATSAITYRLPRNAHLLEISANVIESQAIGT